MNNKMKQGLLLGDGNGGASSMDLETATAELEAEKNYYPLNCPVKDSCPSTGIIFCLTHTNNDYRECDIYLTKKGSNFQVEPIN